MLDENVAASVSRMLAERKFECRYIRDLIPAGAVDQLVAFVAEDENAILVSHDGDFKKINPRIPDGQKKRFRSLSRIHLHCDEPRAASRLESAIDFVANEFALAQNSQDKRMLLTIGSHYIKSLR